VIPITSTESNLRRTICEVLRELYRDAQARGDETSIARLNEAYDMAKRMDAKLRKYKREKISA
jgi:hypothetical protein